MAMLNNQMVDISGPRQTASFDISLIFRVFLNAVLVFFFCVFEHGASQAKHGMNSWGVPLFYHVLSILGVAIICI